MRKSIISFCVLLFVLSCAFTAAAEVGVTKEEIILGQSAALEGAASALGKSMELGLSLYFRHINEGGGVNGRIIRLVSYNDGYEPSWCVEQTEKLINQGVFAFIGFVGTPTSKVAVPLAEENKIPFIGPFTGAEFLRNPVKHYVINLRASYFDETEALVHYLVDKLGRKKIACFYQNDSYGKAGLAGCVRALEKRGLTLVAEGTYKRNTLAVRAGLKKIQAGNPEAVIMVGAYGPCTVFIRLAKQIGLKDVIFCNLSFVGSKALLKALRTHGEGVIVSQVVPLPSDTNIAVVKEYQELLAKYAPMEEPGFVSLEGFLTAKFFVQAVAACGEDLTREKLISTIETQSIFDLGGVSVRFSANDHQGMDAVYFTVIEKGKFKRIENSP